MKNTLLIFLSFIILGLSAQSALAQKQHYTPERGSAERKAILDAIRAERGSADVVYTPSVFLVQNGYAWVVAKSAGGGNQYEDEISLLRKVNGQWKWIDSPCVEEQCSMAKELKRIKKAFPKAPKAIFKME